MHDAIKAFLHYLSAERRYSAHTVAAYGSDLSQVMAAWQEAHGAEASPHPRELDKAYSGTILARFFATAWDGAASDGRWRRCVPFTATWC